MRLTVNELRRIVAEEVGAVLTEAAKKKPKAKTAAEKRAEAEKNAKAQEAVDSLLGRRGRLTVKGVTKKLEEFASIGIVDSFLNRINDVAYDSGGGPMGRGGGLTDQQIDEELRDDLDNLFGRLGSTGRGRYQQGTGRS
jgi:DNA gyrase/topoisomerase IV subunit B